MKKLLLIGSLIAATCVSNAAVFQSYSFLQDTVATNAGAGGLGGIVITNTGTAPLGGYTNVKSSSYSMVIPGTNAMGLTWTNNNGVWVIVTNAAGPTSLTSAVGPTNLAIKWLLSPESADLTKDIPLPPLETGGTPFAVYPGFATNSTFPGSATVALAENAMFGNCTLSCRIFGHLNAGEVAEKLNLIFVGVPSGINGADEPSSLTQTAIPAFQWGITPNSIANGAPNSLTVVTNFPIWRFAGCGAIRLRSASLTTATNNCAVAIQDLRFNGFYPIQK